MRAIVEAVVEVPDDLRARVDAVLEGLARGDTAALARAISLVENQRDGFERVLTHVHERLGRGHVKLVLHFSHHLFQQVFHGHHADHRTEFIHHHPHGAAVAAAE